MKKAKDLKSNSQNSKKTIDWTQWMPLLMLYSKYGMALTAILLVMTCHIPVAVVATVFGAMRFFK